MRGSMRRRGKRSWELTVWLGRDPDTGKPRRRYLSLRGTKRDAERALVEALSQHESGIDIAPNRITVAQFLDQWLGAYAKSNVRASTLLRYRQLVARLNEPLGAYRLQDLRPGHIQGAYARLLEDGLAARGAASPPRAATDALTRGSVAVPRPESSRGHGAPAAASDRATHSDGSRARSHPRGVRR